MKPGWAVVGRCGTQYRHKDLVFFACEGLIAVCDERKHIKDDERYTVIFPDELTERMQALADFSEPFKSAPEAWQREEYRVCQAAAQAAKDCVKEAKYMGDPSDPAVQAFWRLHRPGHKSRVSLSAGTNASGYPELPKLSRGQTTGRTAEGVPLTSVTGEMLVHKPARRKNRSGLILEV